MAFKFLFIVSLCLKKKVEEPVRSLGNLQNHRTHLQKYASMTYNIPIWETTITPFKKPLDPGLFIEPQENRPEGTPPFTYFRHEET